LKDLLFFVFPLPPLLVDENQEREGESDHGHDIAEQFPSLAHIHLAQSEAASRRISSVQTASRTLARSGAVVFHIVV
jgi:hypothetical protein